VVLVIKCAVKRIGKSGFLNKNINAATHKRNIKKITNAFSQSRTDDLLITSEVPYQLGHKGLFVGGVNRLYI
jgi:hypothetical protein